MTISLSLPLLNVVCHPSSHSVISLSLFLSSTNTTYSHHFPTSKEEGQKLTRDKRVSRERVNSGHQNNFQITTANRGKNRYFLHQHKNEYAISDCTGVGPKACVDVRGCRGWNSVAREQGGHLTAG